MTLAMPPLKYDKGALFLGHDLRSKKETFNQRPEAYREYLNFILRALFCSEDPVRGRRTLDTLIEGVKAGELDEHLAQHAKARGVPESKRKPNSAIRAAIRR